MRLRAPVRRWWWIAAAYVAAQVGIVCFAANGPFVDEALYVVAGIRVLEGEGPSDGYVAWLNGSPFVWPVMAAAGHRVAGLPGARLIAVLMSAVTLIAFAKTAETLWGEAAAAWSTAALAANGLFVALGHFAVYDVAALAATAVAMWCVARSSRSSDRRWLIAAGLAFAVAVIAKYGYVLMVAPLAGVLVSTRAPREGVRGLAVFLLVAGCAAAAYFLLCFGSLVPSSSAVYLDQTLVRSRGHIAALQVVFGIPALALAGAGAIVLWPRGHRRLVATCVLALCVYPAFHLWTANFVSGQKHAVAGSLVAYLLCGPALARWWARGSRPALVIALGLLTAWGGVQWYWQEHSWADTRAVAGVLAQRIARGDTVVAESSWIYTLSLYPPGLIGSPANVIDANHAPGAERLDLCAVPWLVGNPDSSPLVRRAIGRCGHRPELSVSSRQHFLDTSRMSVSAQPVVVTLYRLPGR